MRGGSQLYWRVGFNYSKTYLFYVFTACKQFEAVLLWLHFDITLFQLFEHRYHIMPIRLPDKHNVVNHFCLQVQAFLSEQSFPSLSMSCCCSSFTVILLFFKVSQRLVRTSFRPLISFRVTLRVVFCQQVLYMILNTFLSRVSTGIYVKRGVHSNIISRTFSSCATILLNLSVKIIRMFITQPFLVYCHWSLNALYTVVHKV